MNQNIKTWDEYMDVTFLDFLVDMMETCNIVSVIPQRYSLKANKLAKAIIIYTLK